jgi:hypothetical protein
LLDPVFVNLRPDFFMVVEIIADCVVYRSQLHVWIGAADFIGRIAALPQAAMRHTAMLVSRTMGRPPRNPGHTPISALSRCAGRAGVGVRFPR